MVTRIKRDFNFFGGTYLHQEYNIDLFTVTVYADCLTTDPVEQQIALGRIKYLFSKRLENCIFINKDNKKITSCWICSKDGIIRINKKKEDEWKERINILFNQINYWINNKTNKTLEIIHLYYDTFC